ncbi:23S rRNA (guanine(745)-N(1))-methyltransferase [Cellvibrio zantedeschiae]|uniref:23S rRNA (Guanine(745)-N(1))-methyltransferase n=1 Tax=Cellvibrio zantedeschiae TaxID=1237077 RepID=A0ABQ3AWW6_9GAMM|nr:methyltransferase domain-containing protein [Cellvibrio zantedeschiae]GGY69385.1 23S rRNA (guanine(745)-N(1))-methyltransferase [Cellvibrio zantedeschiae]
MKELICPLCSQFLIVNEQGLACANRHQFDRAKEGYFNLLPVHHKNSREPGDAKQQLAARRAFLTAGYFAPLLNELKKIIDPNSGSLLDIGCGEGYFTRGLAEHCKHADIYGIDIAKAGIRLAAKNRPSQTTYVVASSHLLPLADTSMDVIVRIYAPSKDEELFRVLKPDGKLFIVTPGDRHLIELRKRIYKEIKPHPQPKVPHGFKDLSHIEVSFPLSVPAGELTNALLEMTPFAWKLSSDLQVKLAGEGLVDLAHFQISTYEKVSLD